MPENIRGTLTLNSLYSIYISRFTILLYKLYFIAISKYLGPPYLENYARVIAFKPSL